MAGGNRSMNQSRQNVLFTRVLNIVSLGQEDAFNDFSVNSRASIYWVSNCTKSLIAR